MKSLLLIQGTNEYVLLTNDNAPNHSVSLKDHMSKDTKNCIEIFDTIWFNWYEVNSWNQYDLLMN